MAVCWIILRGRKQQMYTVIQAVHSLLYIVEKCHLFSVVTWKDIIQYFKYSFKILKQKCEGCTHFSEILYLSVCLSVCLFIYLLSYHSIALSIVLSIVLSFYFSHHYIYFPHPSVHLYIIIFSIHPSIHPSSCLMFSSIHSSLYLYNFPIRPSYLYNLSINPSICHYIEFSLPSVHPSICHYIEFSQPPIHYI